MAGAGRDTRRRIAGAALLAVAAVVGIATGRMIRDGGRHLEQGMRRLDAHDVHGAAASFEDAARAYAPGSPYPRRALDQLAILAKAAQMRGEEDVAAHFWECARRSAIATRHLWQPNEDLLARAETSIASLRAAAVSERADELPAESRGAPPRPDDPSAIASIFLFAGLVAWISGSIWLCALPPRPRADERMRRAAWITAAAGLACWAVMAFLAG